MSGLVVCHQIGTET